ncbi:unnamed protein product, partial [Discosporangium mesarthrocarpum]
LERLPSYKADSSVMRVVVTFLKSMVGSYILYTPKMVRNGGLLPALLSLVLVALVACDGMVALLACATATGKRTYGQIGNAAFGVPGQAAVEASLVLSQLSFCTAYFIFNSRSLPSVLPTPALGGLAETVLGGDALILLQVLVYVPLALIRRLRYMAPAMLLANACMWLGLLLITWVNATTLATGSGAGLQTVTLGFNPNGFVMSIGAVVVCFEGIGLVLPLRNSLDAPMQVGRWVGRVRV